MSVGVRKLQVAIIARSSREMSLTDRILPRYILSRVRVAVRPRHFCTREKLIAIDCAADGDGGDGCGCARVFARTCMRACARVCARVCMHAYVRACVMCLQYTIKYLTQADNNN